MAKWKVTGDSTIDKKVVEADFFKEEGSFLVFMKHSGRVNKGPEQVAAFIAAGVTSVERQD